MPDPPSEDRRKLDQDVGYPIPCVHRSSRVQAYARSGLARRTCWARCRCTLPPLPARDHDEEPAADRIMPEHSLSPSPRLEWGASHCWLPFPESPLNLGSEHFWRTANIGEHCSRTYRDMGQGRDTAGHLSRQQVGQDGTTPYRVSRMSHCPVPQVVCHESSHTRSCPSLLSAPIR